MMPAKRQAKLIDDAPSVEEARARQAREVRSVIDAMMPDASADGTGANTLVRLWDLEAKLLGLYAPKETAVQTSMLPAVKMTYPEKLK